jgi:oligopeptidase B
MWRRIRRRCSGSASRSTGSARPGRGYLLVFRQTDLSFYTNVSKSKSERYIFIHMESTVASEWRYADADDPALEFKVFLAHERDHEYQIEHLGDRFIVRSNWRAKNFRLMQAPIGANSDRDTWRELVAHAMNVHRGFRRVRGVHRAVGAHRGFAQDPHQAARRARRPARARRSSSRATSPPIRCRFRSIRSSTTDIVRYTYSSLTTPTTVYDYNVRTRDQVLMKRDPVLGDFDPANYRTEFLFAPARDGARIPVSLVYRRDTPLDGSAPLLQYAYGAYGLSMNPSFSSSRFRCSTAASFTRSRMCAAARKWAARGMTPGGSVKR